MGPHPFPTIVRDFQAVISKEIKEQLAQAEGRLPDVVLACVGGGSNAIGTFYNFIGDPSVKLIGCEAAGARVDTPETAATIATGRFRHLPRHEVLLLPGRLRADRAPSTRFPRGSTIPASGPEHAYLHDTGRAEYVPRHRRRISRGLRVSCAHGGHNPRDRERARRRARDEDRAADGKGQNNRRLSLGTRRQGLRGDSAVQRRGFA